ncbi:MAG: MBL fold metallo-hydrolase [Deltaproteobacteria bacterium]|nr:MBL fold metallo-hydrolase [Deltaproteobacteria bacterium]
MKKIAYLLMVLVIIFSLTACDNIVERGLKKQMMQNRADMLKDGNMHVVLVGTGGPFPNTERVSVSTAVIAGGEFILVDTGPGTARNALLQRLPMGNLSAVFLTHFHSDHIADLGEANMYSWVQGNRKKRLEVFGPPGVEQVVKGYALAYAQDSVYRTAHHGEDVAPAEGATLIAKIVTLEAPGKAKLFFDRNGLRAWAFEVDHFPAEPAVGYRFEYKGNVVVITGDTKKTNTLASQADKADLFICDALDAKTIHLAAKVASEVNQPSLSKIFTDITDYHLTPVQAAEIAQNAGVKKLVFYHVVPPLTNFILKRRYLKGVGDVYDGDVEVGEDGMTFTFAPKR